MPITIPASTQTLIHELHEMAAAEEAREHARKLRQEKLLEQRMESIAALDDLRQKRHHRTMACAQDIVEWCTDFTKAPETKPIWDLIGRRNRLTLFYATYWDGLPDTRDVGNHARFVIERAEQIVPCMWYEEVSNGRWSGENVKRKHSLLSAADFVEKLHPDFVSELHVHLIQSDGAWERIEMELKAKAQRP